MSSIDSANGYTQPQKVQYTPPPRPKDDDAQRYRAEDQARADHPAVRITLSPEAQKALAEQRTQTTQT
jgi:hypothetical protein